MYVCGCARIKFVIVIMHTLKLKTKRCITVHMHVDVIRLCAGHLNTVIKSNKNSLRYEPAYFTVQHVARLRQFHLRSR